MKSEGEIAANRIYNLHLEVLSDILLGKPFENILLKYDTEFRKTNYLNIIKKAGHLSFDDNNNLVGAYPISPIKTDFVLEIEGIGKGYSMCAVDSLGTAFTFMKNVKIQSIDKSTGELLEINIDPNSPNHKVPNLLVTYKESPNGLQGENAAAIVQCPTINFYSTHDNIPKNLQIWDFQKALEYSKFRFGRKEMIRRIKSVL